MGQIIPKKLQKKNVSDHIVNDSEPFKLQTFTKSSSVAYHSLNLQTLNDLLNANIKNRHARMHACTHARTHTHTRTTTFYGQQCDVCLCVKCQQASFMRCS